MVLLWGLCNWVENPKSNWTDACEDHNQSICHNKDYKPPFYHCLSLIHWYFVEKDCCGFVCVCLGTCYVVCLYVQSTTNRYRQIRKTHSDYAWGMSPGYRNWLCVYLCVCGCGGGGGWASNTVQCNEDPLSTTHIPPLHNPGAIYRNKYNRKEPADLLQIYAPLLLPTVALACSKAAFDGGRISLWATCDGLTGWLQMFPNETRRRLNTEGACLFI